MTQASKLSPRLDSAPHLLERIPEAAVDLSRVGQPIVGKEFRVRDDVPKSERPAKDERGALELRIQEERRLRVAEVGKVVRFLPPAVRTEKLSARAKGARTGLNFIYFPAIDEAGEFRQPEGVRAAIPKGGTWFKFTEIGDVEKVIIGLPVRTGRLRLSRRAG